MVYDEQETQTTQELEDSLFETYKGIDLDNYLSKKISNSLLIRLVNWHVDNYVFQNEGTRDKYTYRKLNIYKEALSRALRHQLNCLYDNRFYFLYYIKIRTSVPNVFLYKIGISQLGVKCRYLPWEKNLIVKEKQWRLPNKKSAELKEKLVLVKFKDYALSSDELFKYALNSGSSECFTSDVLKLF